MVVDNTQLNRKIAPAMIAVFAALSLSACASISGSTAEGENLQAEETDDAMRAECMAMHEKMKAKMAEGGMAMKEAMMSPEMKAKHEQCMAMMHGPAAQEHEEGEEQ